MSRRTAIMLLQHGPLSLCDFKVITGWHYRKCDRLLRELWIDGFLVKTERGLYALKEVAHA